MQIRRPHRGWPTCPGAADCHRKTWRGGARRSSPPDHHSDTLGGVGEFSNLTHSLCKLRSPKATFTYKWASFGGYSSEVQWELTALLDRHRQTDGSAWPCKNLRRHLNYSSIRVLFFLTFGSNKSSPFINLYPHLPLPIFNTFFFLL